MKAVLMAALMQNLLIVAQQMTDNEPEPRDGNYSCVHLLLFLLTKSKEDNVFNYFNR
jgi:hypothetical protein